MLQDGMAWLNDKLRKHVSRQVIYRRGRQSATVTATVGMTLLKLGDEYGGVRIERTDRDYLIAAADLVLGGQQIEPERGDVIEDVNDPGELLRRYEVRAPENEPAWRWSDPFKIVARIHTKYVGVD